MVDAVVDVADVVDCVVDSVVNGVLLITVLRTGFTHVLAARFLTIPTSATRLPSLPWNVLGTCVGPKSSQIVKTFVGVIRIFRSCLHARVSTAIINNPV